MTTLKVGDKAPPFEGKNQAGEIVSLDQFKGQKVALYFYPHDMTPTCTTEACNLRDHFKELKDAGITVIGVSEDSEQKHQKFIEKYSLPFDLIADTDHTILKSYGVWGKKKFMGREYDGTHRTTFLIDEDGKIAAIINKVKAKEHHQQILEGFAR